MDTQTSTGEPRSDAPRPAREGGFFAALRRSGVSRSDDRWVGGVAAGTADRFGIDPLLVRGLLAVSVLLGGLGLVAYAVAWVLLPERSDGRIHLEELVAGRFDGAVVGAGALLLAGLVRGDGWWLGNGDAHVLRAIGWLAFLGLVIWVLATVLRRPGGARPVPPAPGPAGPYGPFPPPPGATTGWAGPADAGAGASTGGATDASSGATSGTPTAATPAAGYAWAEPVPTRTDVLVVPPAGPVPSAWSGASGGSGGSGGPGGSGRPPRPPRPPRPARRGPAAGTVGVVVALSILGLALLLLADRSGGFDGPVALTAAGAGLVLLGLGIVVSGLQGRSSGWLGFLAVVTGLVAVPAAIGLSSGAFDTGGTRVADQQVVWTQRAQAREGFEAGVGDVRLDLTQVPLTGGTLVVPVDVGAGDVTVVVPQGARVSADLDAGLGSITWDVDGVREQRDGAGSTLRTSTADVADGRSAQLHVVAHLGLGDLTVEEE